MSMSGMLEMRAEVEAARAALKARAIEAAERVKMLAPEMSGAIGECSIEEATIALVREFEAALRGKSGCPECGSIVAQAGCPVCGTPANDEPGFARCPECGNLAMNPLPSCATCGSPANEHPAVL